jgi:hypothetical protein
MPQLYREVFCDEDSEIAAQHSHDRSSGRPAQTLRHLFYGAEIEVFPLVLLNMVAVSLVLRGKV